MGNITQDRLFQLSSKFSKTLKSKFGKGPESCYLTFIENRLFIYVNQFMTPAEEVLVKNNQWKMAWEFRRSVMNVICGEFIEEASSAVGVLFQTSLHDWSFEINKGILIMETNQPTESCTQHHSGEKTLLKVLENLSAKIHKVPDEMKIVKSNQNVCVIESKGVMTSLDMYLFQNGYSDILNSHSRELKMTLLVNKVQFEETLHRVIDEFFIIWDYENNKNYIVIVFQ